MLFFPYIYFYERYGRLKFREIVSTRKIFEHGEACERCSRYFWCTLSRKIFGKIERYVLDTSSTISTYVLLLKRQTKETL